MRGEPALPIRRDELKAADEPVLPALAAPVRPDPKVDRAGGMGTKLIAWLPALSFSDALEQSDDLLSIWLKVFPARLHRVSQKALSMLLLNVLTFRLYHRAAGQWATPMPRGEIRIRTEDGDLNQIKSRMRERRKKLKMTQEMLCGRVADVTAGRWVPARMDIVRIENGGRIVSDLELLALAKALECSPSWLLTGSGSIIF